MNVEDLGIAIQAANVEKPVVEDVHEANKT